MRKSWRPGQEGGLSIGQLFAQRLYLPMNDNLEVYMIASTGN